MSINSSNFTIQDIDTFRGELHGALSGLAVHLYNEDGYNIQLQEMAKRLNSDDADSALLAKRMNDLHSLMKETASKLNTFNELLDTSFDAFIKTTKSGQKNAADYAKATADQFAESAIIISKL